METNMKTLDCIKQLITNEPTGWDSNDTFSFSLYDAEFEGVTYASISIDYEAGVLECYDSDNNIIVKRALKIQAVESL